MKAEKRERKKADPDQIRFFDIPVLFFLLVLINEQRIRIYRDVGPILYIHVVI